MPKFSVNATELTDTNVDFVALVKRGANRIPFRITKAEDNDMIDLHKIGRQLFKSDPTPAVVAVYVEKGADLPKITAALKSAGIDVATFEKSEQDGGTSLIRKGEEAQDVALIKMAGNVSLAVSHVAKMFQQDDYQSPDFNEVHSKGSHMQSLNTATTSLHHTLGNIMQNAKDPKEAAKQMGEACDAHKAHCAKLTRALPVQAFKADVALAKAFQAAGGTDDDQETGDDGDMDQGNVAAKDPLMPSKNPAKKADAGKNGTGAGAELGEGTGTDDRATADDAQNNEVDAKPGERTSGDDSGMPDKLKAPTKKSAAILKAELAVAQAQLALAKFDGDGDEDDADVSDDDSTNGAQSKLPAKAKAPTTKQDIKGLPDPVGESAAGEGAAQDPDKRPEDNATSDDAANAGGDVTGKVKGKTLDTDGIPAKAMSPTTKNDGDDEIGKKGQGKQLDDSMSGSGAQQSDAQTLKSDETIMKALQSMSKSVKESIAAVTKSVEDLNARVEQVATMAKKTDAALNGTVFNEAAGDTVWTKKSETSGAPPLLDTAYSRRGAA